MTSRVDLLAVDGPRHVGRSPDELRLLAEAGGAAGVRGGRRVAGLLRAQAEHLEAAQVMSLSPFAARLRG